MRIAGFGFKSTPRWVIQFIDLFISAFSFIVSFLVVKQLGVFEVKLYQLVIYAGSFCMVTTTVFYLMGIHKGLIRYSNVKDLTRIFVAVLLSSIIFLVVVHIVVENVTRDKSLDLDKVLFVNFFIASTFLILLRAAVKESFLYAKHRASFTKEKVLIFGSNVDAIILKNALEAVTSTPFHVVGFLDSRKQTAYTSIEQKKIYPVKDLSLLQDKYDVQKVMLINKQPNGTAEKHVIERCLQLGIKIVTVPPSDEWICGKLTLNQIKNLNIEDLLQRDPIIINNSSVSNQIFGKSILVTGAAGSIGSELVRQLLPYNPQLIVLCDQAESALHDLQLEIEEKFPNSRVVIFIGSIQNYKRMEMLFKQYQPGIVFHAAAYKHVPMMENHPSEAVLANVLGTKNLSELALVYDAEKFVMISTDKAVNPSSIMGASKRIAEMYIQSLSHLQEQILHLNKQGNVLYKFLGNSRTKFITTRFGNVLGSNGSVIPRFRDQIEKGGPITVTHPEITRYFMTIPEAVQLVLEAATMGNGGEIYVFDMGAPIRIVDLANQMIKLAGMEPGKDIKIEFTGLRQGEKLYEELLSDKEVTSPTHHKKIHIAKVIANEYEDVLESVDSLIMLTEKEDNMLIAKKMKEIVKEFVSKNSEFEYLDKVNSVRILENKNENRRAELISVTGKSSKSA